MDKADQLAEQKGADSGHDADDQASSDMRIRPNRGAPTCQPGNAGDGPLALWFTICVGASISFGIDHSGGVI